METFWIELIKAFGAVLALMLSNASIVQALKNLVEILLKGFPALKVLQIRDEKSYIIAAVVAVTLNVVFKLDFVEALGLKSYVSPDMVTLISAAITLLGSNIFYNKFMKK